MKQNGNDELDDKLEKFEAAWSDMMIDIWQEKINKLRAQDTHSLETDMSGSITHSSGITHMIHKFLEYGLYVDAGTGNGYKRDNGGNLRILDPEYREKHHLKNKPRVKKPWFSKAYYRSVMVMREKMATIYGEEAAVMLAKIITADNIQYK